MIIIKLTIPTLPIWYLYLVPTLAIFFINFLISSGVAAIFVPPLKQDKIQS